MNFNILLIGSGNLGRRYLEGLDKVRLPLNINIIDTCTDSLNLAKKTGSMFSNKIHNLNYYKSLEELTHIEMDLCIVSTTANSRCKVIKTIVDKFRVKNWIVEKLIEQSKNNILLINKLINNPANSWVNTPRRIMKWHKDIKNALSIDLTNENGLEVNINGGNWGMACNSIHMIDLVSWWTGLDISYIDSSNIKYWNQSKREGFMEAYGSIKVQYNKGTKLNISCNENDEPFTIKVSTNYGIWDIYESMGSAKGPNGKDIKGRILYQSEITSFLVEEILISNQCDLPNLFESSLMHINLVSSLLLSWNKHMGTKNNYLPVT